MKALAALIMTASIFVVSYLVMIFGWGVEPKSNLIIFASYLWMLCAPFVIEVMKND